MNWKQREVLEELAGIIIGLLILGVFGLGAYIIITNINEEVDTAKKTRDDFCPEGRTYESSLFGESKRYCQGKQYTCELEKCYWINYAQEKD